MQMKQMKILFKSMSLSIGLGIVVALRLALKPVSLLDKGLRLSGKWMLSQWVIR